MKTLKQFSEEIRQKIAHHADLLPQEAEQNHMLVGRFYKGATKKVFYKPHNYRLYFDFNPASLTNPKPTPKGWIYKGIVNGTERLYTYRLFNIRVKKTQVEVQNKDNRWFPVELSTDSKKQIQDIINKKDEQCIRILKSFIYHFKGFSEFKILNRHSEDKITSEDSIDLIPIKQKWHTDTAKKVYNEPNVEFSSPAFASNYISSRAVEDIAPEIAEAIREVNPLQALKSKVSKIDDIFVHKELVAKLSENDKREYEDWIFKQFGEEL